MATCPIGFAPAGGICSACQSPCLTCSESVTNCTSCVATVTPAVFLSNFQCVETCPMYTYANSSNQQCTPCVAPCVTCTSQSQCLSCDSSTNLYQQSCLTNCPAGFTAIAQVCVSCTSPCLTCSTSQLTCTSCIKTLSPPVFLNGNNCVEAANCPSGTYASLSTNKCENC